MKQLLSAGADVNARMQNSGTALMVAAQNGHAEVVRLLKRAAQVARKAEVRGTMCRTSATNQLIELVKDSEENSGRVRRIQEFLKAQDFEPRPIGGFMGRKTRRAITAWERECIAYSIFVSGTGKAIDIQGELALVTTKSGLDIGTRYLVLTIKRQTGCNAKEW